MSSYLKYIRPSKYKYVDLYQSRDGSERWRICVNKNSKYFDNERDAAIAVDKILISKSKNPVNILKKAQ